jgi:hypothetical protein
MLLGCVYAREVWFRFFRPSGLQHLAPDHDANLPDWWCDSRKRVPKAQRKGFDSMVVLACWGLWKERNRRVFNNAMAQAAQLSSWIMEEGRWWAVASYRCVSQFLRYPPSMRVSFFSLVKLV